MTLNNKGQIIMPLIISTPQPCRCPKCKNIEDIKEVCKNCGYEYPELEGNDVIPVVFAIAIIIFGTWFLITILSWLLCNDDQYSLLQILQNQVKWLTTLKFI